ncbi:hypothetical protein BJX96DRAFT_157084 [Aspergillus floccosus]
MPFTGYFLRRQHLRRKQLWYEGETDAKTDVVIVCDGVKLPVHSGVLSAESPHFRQWLQAARRENNSLEMHVDDSNIHTVWRTLELVYLRSYTTEKCPKAAIEDDQIELLRHAHVYQLAKSWGLSKELQGVAYVNCQRELDAMQTSSDLLKSSI